MNRLLRTLFAIAIYAAVYTGSSTAYPQSGQVVFENYTLENGLPNNTVHQAFQDSRGYMWFATNHGVCRYDGYKFTSFRNDPTDSSSLAGLLARVIYEDRSGALWIGTESGGLNRFNRQLETFEHILWTDSARGIGTSVKTIAEDAQGRLWLGTNLGIKMYDPKLKQVQWYPFTGYNSTSPSNAYVRVLQFDGNGKLWVGTNAGLDRFDPATKKFTHLYTAEAGLKDEIWEIYRDPSGTMWVGTYNNGLFLVNPATLAARHVVLGGEREWSKTIRSVVRDEQGLYWIGSRAGLYVYNAATGIADWFGNVENEPKSLVNNSVLHVFKDAGKNLWISTRGGVSLMVPGRQAFKHYGALRNSAMHLNSKEVYAAWADGPGDNIWIGTGDGGVNILNRKTGQYIFLTHSESNTNSLAGNAVKAFADDGRGNRWVGMYKTGISVYNTVTKQFTHFKNDPSNPASLSDNSVWALLKDKKGNMWVGTDAGLDLYNEQTENFIHQELNNKNQQVSWISEDKSGQLWLGLQSSIAVFKPGTGIVNTFREQGSCIYEDSKGRCWLATRDNGLVLFDAKKGPLKYYDERNGLPNNQVFQILEDDQNNLWLSTANGLAMFNAATETFTNFDKRDGLQNNQFHYGAACKLSSGELIFGGVNGFNLFDPAKVVKNNYKPPVMLTGLKIFNKPVEINDQFGVLKNSPAETKELIIPYNYNILTFEFAALNYIRPEKNQYKFKLTGFDKTWNESGAATTATYTNLDPGAYTFSVIAANNDQLWNNEGLNIRVVILPPFWKTWWFRLLVIAAALAIVHVIISFIVNRQKIKQQLNMERVKVKQLNEVNALKLRFFTNVSHEIRTPLTLIIGPLERLLHADMPPKIIRSQLEIMYRNANSLLKLVNQLLDFRKLEAGNLELELQRGDLVFFIRDIVGSFSGLAEDKNIRLHFNAYTESLYAFFDGDKLEKILNNLLSNALKFTAKNGTVSVYMTVGVEDAFDSNNEFVEIVVKDNGIGIEARNRERIFHRFFQVAENKNEGGTGIGLALTRELVKMHRGEIFADSEPGKGTRFTVRLPLIKEYNALKTTAPAVAEALNNEAETELPVKREMLTENILLVIEDNADVRQFIRAHFQNQFHIEEAADGEEGLRLAKKLLPDIILSDVMMPQMDGNELCKKLKADEYTSHIPIILLTALSSKQHIIEGLSSGADDYITKPFDISILQTKIENLLLLRNSMRKKFSGELIIAPTNVTATSHDELFLQQAVEVVEKNMADTELDIETFSKHMGVSRMQMYRKLSALTGMTIKEFIRDIRLKRAAQLLEQKQLNISEVAYATGFKDISTFRKSFKERYGINATGYVKKTAQASG